MMTCSICKHKKRLAIEAEIVRGTSLRDIARQFAASKDSVARHRSICMREELAASQEAREELHAINVAEQLAELNAKTLTILEEARAAVARIERDQADALPEEWPSLEEWQEFSEEQQRAYRQRRQDMVKERSLVGRRRQNEIRNALAAIEQAHAQVKTQAELQGDLAPAGTVNIWVNQEWVGIRKLLLDTLRPFPEARVAVAQALLVLEQEATDDCTRPA